MDVVLPALILIAFVAAWVYLPFAPAVRELQERTDVEPVKVVPESAVDVHYFANNYRRFIDQHLAWPLARCREEGVNQYGKLEEGIPYAVVAGWDPQAPPVGMVLCSGTLRVPDKAVLRFEVYAGESLQGGERCVYKSVLAERDIDLAFRSTSLRWLHAGATVRVDRDSWLYGRVSAGTSIELAEGCAFERLHAPRVLFGRELHVEIPAARGALITPRDLPDIADISAGRWLIKGQVKLPAGRRLEADLVTTGDLRVSKGAQVKGSLKSHRDVYLGRGVEVHGSVVARRNLYIGEGCRIHGPVLAEEAIFVGVDCRIGSAEIPTTVSARRIHVSDGVVVHGTVWAHQEGLVTARALSGVKGLNGLNGPNGRNGA
ncbi:MAG: hypothetical protein H6Q08_2439 [Acidobacteria bacterium]|nr:hypothetical protein [Acidobacteriota bacterium]